MKRFRWGIWMALAVLLSGVFAGSVVAQKPPWAGGNDKDKGHQKETKSKHGGEEDYDRRDDYHDYRYDHHRGDDHRDHRDDRYREDRHRYFDDHQRDFIHDYYADQYRRGHCPPGLAKKGNGCRPPGQAKKWAIGRPLPRDVIFHDLPYPVLKRLGPPPSRHRFVRVAQDILLIAVGTGMVVDAIEDLNWEFGH